MEVFVIRVLGLMLGLLPPSTWKNRLMTWFVPGWRVAPDARVRPCVLWSVRSLEIGSGVDVGVGNVFRTLRRVRLGPGSQIGQFNWFSAAARFGTSLDDPLVGTLELAGPSTVTSRHYLDCSGGVALGEMSIIAGVRSTFLTHGVDESTVTVGAMPIRIGERCLVNSACVVMGGVTIASRCVVGAGAVVARDLTDGETLYGGVPAKPIRSLSGSPFFDRPSLDFIPRGSGTVAANAPEPEDAAIVRNGRSDGSRS